MATTTLMSFAEFEHLDAGADHIELLKGELIRVPPAKREHNETAERLFLGLHAALERLRLSLPGRTFGKVHYEMGYCLGRKRRINGRKTPKRGESDCHWRCAI